MGNIITSVIRVICLLPCCLILVSCATKPVDQGELPRVKTIGVVSVIGKNFFYQKVGITVFGNETSKGDISNWQIDSFVTSLVSNQLTSKFTVLPVNIDRSVLYKETGFF